MSHGFDDPHPDGALRCICRFWATTRDQFEWHYTAGYCPYGSEVK